MKKNKIKNKKLFLAFFLIIFLSVGFAILSVNLGLNGNLLLSSQSFKVYFDNVEVSDDSVNAVTPYIDEDDGTSLEFNVELDKPGDLYSFDVDIVNGGTIDAIINDYNLSGIDEHSDYAKVKITYSDGTPINKGDKLGAYHSKKLHFEIEYDSNINKENLPTIDKDFTLTFTIEYVQDREVESNSPICRAANGSNWDRVAEENFGTFVQNHKLETGNVFWCDLDGSGNSEYEFYYLSDYYDTETGEFDEDVAVLVFSSIIYDDRQYSKVSYTDSASSFLEGPKTAVSILPDDWTNFSLYKKNRKVTNNLGESLYSFDYSGHTTRLLTVQEIVKGCGDVFSDNGLMSCRFLLQGTSYEYGSNGAPGYLLENISSVTPENVYYVDVVSRSVKETNKDNNTYGVRVAVDIKKSDLEY